ncbi:MBL fold metallo-hydrolase [Paenibacillus sp. IHBB 10380]|uniref:MBL fold metallo-hydrolase n=1 Tax=Paenibacillus sp. IHBB 10380 TaxID=1566358 RepID=UPI000695DDBC
MKIRQIRNATMVLNYGNMTFLIDPFLGAKGVYPPFPNTSNQVNNPTAELPIPVEEIVQTDAVIVTHLHPTISMQLRSRRFPKILIDKLY